MVWVPDDPGHPPTDQSQHSDVCIAPLSFSETVQSDFAVSSGQSCVLPVLPEETEREESHTRLPHTPVSRQLPVRCAQTSGTPPRRHPPLVAPDPPALVREWPYPSPGFPQTPSPWSLLGRGPEPIPLQTQGEPMPPLGRLPTRAGDFLERSYAPASEAEAGGFSRDLGTREGTLLGRSQRRPNTVVEKSWIVGFVSFH